LSATGEWAPWIEFFAKAIAIEARNAQSRIARLLDLRDELSAAVGEHLPRGRLTVDIVDDLIEYAILSVSSVEHRYTKTNQAARDAVKRLIDVGLLEPYNDVAHSRLFWNPRVFRVIEK
jgi:hypothetical protein